LVKVRASFRHPCDLKIMQQGITTHRQQDVAKQTDSWNCGQFSKHIRTKLRSAS